MVNRTSHGYRTLPVMIFSKEVGEGGAIRAISRDDNVRIEEGRENEQPLSDDHCDWKKIFSAIDAWNRHDEENAHECT